ncbi:MAG: phosphatase [Thaumarchaeota archaeon]|nr:phosphatase [Nitrososphaerota archaeon]MBI3642353.1 phosphatase [Nitrososphaerota archaeon]
MTLKKLDNGIFVDPSKSDKIKCLDGIIFDCDGVLIDVSNSYDLAIKKTTDFIVKEFAKIDQSNFVNTQMIGGFKDTGGFNDEVDVTYSMILSVITAKKLKKPFSKFIFDVIKNSDQSGIQSVEKYLDILKVDLSEIRKKLAYPGPRYTSALSSVFDEIFYGAELYYDLYKKKPDFFDGKGLIENDVVLVKKLLIDSLKKKFGKKPAIVSGRGNISARYSLKELFKEFDLNNSKFLEDEQRDLAKPNPTSLISSIKGLGSTCTMFVGDSMEDYIMAKKSDEMGYKTIFCGIYGTSKEPETKRKLFEKKNVEIILETIDLIPKTLNLVGA